MRIYSLYLVLLFLVAQIVIGRFSVCLNAQYPEKNIKTIVHVSAGGGTDAITRLVLKYAGQKLGTSFFIENREGAGGQIGYSILAMAKPDGYTIGSITTASILTHEMTRKNVNYTIKDSFIPICRIASDPSVLFVRADSPIKSFEDLMKKAKSNPGTISCGGTMIWGTNHIHYILLDRICGIKLNYIPFDGVSECRNYLLGGHIEMAIGGSVEFLPLLQAGKVRAIVVAGEKRMKEMPDVPVYSEFGYDLVVSSDKGLAAPKNTPPEYIQRLSDAVFEAMNDPEFLKESDRIMLTPVIDFLNPFEFRKYLLNQVETYEKIILKK
jgi:tripartite-type tricarboxylate transporter receptor subunit TctC